MQTDFFTLIDNRTFTFLKYFANIITYRSSTYFTGFTLEIAFVVLYVNLLQDSVKLVKANLFTCLINLIYSRIILFINMFINFTYVFCSGFISLICLSTKCVIKTEWLLAKCIIELPEIPFEPWP